MDNQFNQNNGMIDNNVQNTNVNVDNTQNTNGGVMESNTQNTNFNSELSSNLNTKNNGGSNKALIIIIIILLLIILAGGVYFVFLQKNNKTNDGSLTTTTTVEAITEEAVTTETTDQVTTEAVDPTVNGNVGNDWKNYSFMVNGKSLSLPLTYTELSTATGFTIKSDFQNSTIPKGYYTLVNLYKNDKLALYTEMTNNTENDVKYTDATVTRVSQTNYQVETGKADKIVFPGNLTVGMTITKDQIIKLFGEPTKINNYNSDNYNKDTYDYNADTNWTTTNYYKIEVLNGVIDTLTLDNRN